MTTQYFTAEHEELRATVRRFAETELAPHALEWERDAYFADWVFPRMGELGLLGLRYPVEYGGQGGDYFAAVVMAEELARSQNAGLGMAVAVQAEMATPPIFKFGTEEQKQRYLVPALRGTKVAALGITEPDAGSDVANIQTWARRDGDDYVINGSKMFITNGVRADFIVLVTKTERAKGFEGVTLFVVDTDTPGFIRSRKLEKVGMLSSDTAELAFEDMRVPASAVLGEVGQGFYHIMWELQGERMIGAAGAVAGAQLTFERALEYARERRAFGKPIGQQQVIKHMLADMATQIEAARQLVYATAWKWDRGEYPVKEISMAKLMAGIVSHDVADKAIQIFGGAGYMMDNPVQRSWRDTRLIRIGAGTDEIMKEIIGKSYGL
ncbi:MAG TPA: acyl-CoA dehydrogenase family protein [Candidatus Dormibacteraeota bacterium]|jgi:alkylation response protein AidB-like acyl-CoA dehydrogenase|nr:acyl-CoA dehydrogenase family protein [Candidatus Dormibacteraeota bacterium]